MPNTAHIIFGIIILKFIAVIIEFYTQRSRGRIFCFLCELRWFDAMVFAPIGRGFKNYKTEFMPEMRTPPAAGNA